MNEKRWALIGKVLVIFSVAVGLILGLFQLADRLKTPSVFAILEIRRDYTNPKIRDKLKERIETKKLLDLIQAQKKKGETPDKILKAIENTISKKEWVEFDELISSMEFSGLRMEFEIGNNGASLARDVRLILPGDGIAEISERGPVGTSKKIDWSGQIPLGDVRPKGKLEVKVWPKSIVFGSFDLINPAIVHSSGTGKVMELHSFYGWQADLVAWFVSRGLVFQIVSASLALTIFVIIIWVALRRGYIVLRPAKHS